MSGFEHRASDQHVSPDYLSHALRVAPTQEAFTSKVRATHEDYYHSEYNDSTSDLNLYYRK